MFTIIISVIILLISAYYFIGFSNESYWKKRGATYHRRNMVWLVWDFVRGDRSLYEIFGDVYYEHPGAPAVGSASFLTPTIFVTHPKNIQYVLAENFSAFYHRGVDMNKNDKLANSVIFMNGPEWKLMRQKMSPLFTTSKLKNMHYIMEKSAEDFVDYLNNNLDKANQNAYETTTLFCCAAITAAVFGVGTGSTFKSPFLNVALAALKPSWRSSLKFSLLSVTPKLFNFLDLKIFGECEDTFIGAMKQVLREREKVKDSKAHDFLDLAVKLQQEGTMKDEKTAYQIETTDDLIAAQGFFFLIAGVEPSATGMFFTLYELARHPELLKKVQDEIDAAYRETDGKITFDTIMNMKYVDQCLEEALRMYPPIGFLGRKCTENSVLPVGSIPVDKDTLVTIPVIAIQRDPKFYPNPTTFDPERFGSDAAKRPNMTFLSFGEGNRLCIGSRFAYLQMKTGLIQVLRNFDVKTSDPLSKDVRFLKAPFALRPSKGTNFHFVPRKNIPS